MIETWFISDTHFGHKNILEYEKEKRPFETVEEMNDVIIERWNNVVKPNDIIYHLGDFCFGKRNIEIAYHLNGKKRLVMGNHDIYPISDYAKFFDKVYGALFWRKCILTHIPVHPNNLASRYLLNVHGHLHSKKVTIQSADWIDMGLETPDDRNYLNVSCEQNNLTPIHESVIMDRLNILFNQGERK